VPCPAGTGFALAAPWVAGAAMLALVLHAWRAGVRGPLPAAAAPFVLGSVPGARFAALLLRCVRLDHGGPVAASGPEQVRARNVLLALSLTGAVLGCCAGAALF
jgi:hypothetical protein